MINTSFSPTQHHQPLLLPSNVMSKIISNLDIKTLLAFENTCTCKYWKDDINKAYRSHTIKEFPSKYTEYAEMRGPRYRSWKKFYFIMKDSDPKYHIDHINYGKKGETIAKVAIGVSIAAIALCGLSFLGVIVGVADKARIAEYIRNHPGVSEKEAWEILLADMNREATENFLYETYGDRHFAPGELSYSQMIGLCIGGVVGAAVCIEGHQANENQDQIYEAL